MFLIICSTFIKNTFDTNSKLFSQKYVGNKQEKIINRKVFKFLRSSQVFPNVGENSLFWRGINNKKPT